MKPYSIILILVLCSCATWTPADKALLTASWIATAADYKTQMDLFDRGGYECNPIMGRYPSKDKFLGIMLTGQIAVTIAAHFLPKYRKAILGTKTVLNTGLAIHNSKE